MGLNRRLSGGKIGPFNKDNTLFPANSSPNSNTTRVCIYFIWNEYDSKATYYFDVLPGCHGFPTAYGGDSESIARRPGGDLIISFERNHRLLTYSGELTVKLMRPLGIQ